MADKKRIAILDDEPIVCERLQPALEKLGFYVETFTESQAAIDRCADGHFDVLVTDLKMRKPDGLDVMNHYREHAPATRVIIITGFATVETAKDALKGGAVDFITKPFKIKQLCDLVVSLTCTEDD